jgi:hypothetical protein
MASAGGGTYGREEIHRCFRAFVFAAMVKSRAAA